MGWNTLKAAHLGAFCQRPLPRESLRWGQSVSEDRLDATFLNQSILGNDFSPLTGLRAGPASAAPSHQNVLPAPPVALLFWRI